MAQEYGLSGYKFLIEALFGVPHFLVAAKDKRFPFGELEVTTDRLVAHWKATTSRDVFKELDIPSLADFIRALSERIQAHLITAEINASPGMLIKREMRNLAYSMSYRILAIWLSHQSLAHLHEMYQPMLRPIAAEDFVVPRPAIAHYRDSPEEHIEDWPDIVDREKVWAAVRKEDSYTLLREIYSYVSDRMDLGLEPL